MPVQPPRTLSDLTQSDRFEILIDAVKDYAIYLLDAEGNVATWNTGAERFKGYKADEIVGQHFSRFYTEEDRAIGMPGRALQTAATEGRFEAEGWRVRKDGSRFWTHVVIDPVIGDQGAVIGFAKITRDVTDKRAADEALRASEQQFRLLVQGVRDYAIYMLDPEGRVTNWNPGAQAIKGYSEEEIVGQHFRKFYTDDDQAAGMPERALATAVREGRWRCNGSARAANGSGPASSSTRFTTTRANWWVSQRSPATSPNAAKRRTRSRRHGPPWFRPRKWKQLAA
jgi:PAS domain S-box-containing protein